jgi:hypothetical protein
VAFCFFIRFYLIAGGIIQPRFPRLGRWFAWIGAAGLGMVLSEYDLLLFHRPWGDHHDVVVAAFSSLCLISTVLVICCYVELGNDVRKRMIALRSTPQTEICPLGAWAWVFAALFNLLIGWSVISALMSGYRSVDSHALVTDMVWVIAVVVLDIELIKRMIPLSQG